MSWFGVQGWNRWFRGLLLRTQGLLQGWSRRRVTGFGEICHRRIHRPIGSVGDVADAPRRLRLSLSIGSAAIPSSLPVHQVAGGSDSGGAGSVAEVGRGALRLGIVVRLGELACRRVGRRSRRRRRRLGHFKWTTVAMRGRGWRIVGLRFVFSCRNSPRISRYVGTSSGGDAGVNRAWLSRRWWRRWVCRGGVVVVCVADMEI